MRCVPPDSAVSWFCPVPAAGRADTQPAALHVRAKDRGATLLFITKKSVSAPTAVPESPMMCNFTAQDRCGSFYCNLLGLTQILLKNWQ